MTSPLVARMRSSLTAAMRRRDTDRVAALRVALAAVANAEAVAVPASRGGHATSEHVAGTARGLGAGEVAREELGSTDVVRVLGDEIEDRRRAAEEYEALGQADAAARSRRVADVLAELVDAGHV